MRNKWTVESETPVKRVSVKLVRGVTVRRIEVYGCRSDRKNAMGAYARPRWSTRGFRTQDGEFHTNWNDVLGYVGDPETRAKLAQLQGA